MTEPVGRLRRFLRELKRRNVYRVAVTYAVVGFVLVQVADLTFVRLGLPSWTVTFVIVLVALGFPLAVVLAWAFEMTPEGVRRTRDARTPDEGPALPEERRSRSRLAVTALAGLGLVGAAVAGGWYLTGGGGETGPRAGERSIAVLPFEALGQDEPGTFTEGMHDDLLTRLSNISGLTVISRTAVQQFRDTELTTRQIADSLGVRWVMEGGVQEMGDQIQVNAQLIDPRTEGHAWADSYRRELTAEDLFALQSEITKRIARSLEAELTPAETERVERRPTEDLEAYKLYVQGRSRLDARTEPGVRDAVDYFRRAIEQDSSYALAWSGLADATGLYPRYGPDSVPAFLPDHEEAARRAVELDPELAEAHASMGFVHLIRHDGPAALRELRRAVELKPSYGQAHHWLANTYMDVGRPAAALEHISLAVELTPRRTAREVLVAALIAEGDLEAAERHLRPLSTSSGSTFRALKGEILYQTRRWGELETWAREQLGEDTGSFSSLWRFYLARIAALRGDTAEAREHLAELQGTGEHWREGLVHAALGEEDEAFSAWDQVETWAGAPLFALRYWRSDVLAPLRDDPRYRELIREINRQWGLDPDGSLPDSGALSGGSPGEE